MTLQEIVLGVQMYGLKFRDMDDMDREAFAGAEEGTLIAESDVGIYFLKGNRLDVLTEDSQTTFDLDETSVLEF